jgi:hypothetical protein
LKHLLCYGCTLLTRIPKEFVNLRELCVSKCPNITHIPKELVNLTSLNCSDNPLLIYIPKELVKLSYLSCDNCPNLIDVPRHLIYYETVIDYKLENMIKENYQRYRKQQCSILINTILEELIQRTWEPVRAMEWCWDEEEKKFMSNILN